VKSRIKLAIDVSPGSVPVFRAMAARSRAVQIVENTGDCTALITDNVESAMTAENGPPVLVVNPFGLAAETCQRLADSTQSMPAHTARFMPAIEQVKLMLDEKKLGEAGLLRIHCWNPKAENKETLAREVDLALWMFGSLPSEVYGLERPGYVQVHLGFERGGMAIIDLDAAIPPGNEYYSLSMIGSTGAAYADDHHNFNLLMGQDDTSVLLASQGDTTLVAMIDNFATAVREGGPFSPSWSDTKAAQYVADQVRVSAQQQAVVTTGGSHV